MKKILVVCKDIEDVQTAKHDYTKLVSNADYHFVDVSEVERLNGEQAIFMSNKLLRTGSQKEKDLVVSLRDQIR